MMVKIDYQYLIENSTIIEFNPIKTVNNDHKNDDHCCLR